MPRNASGTYTHPEGVIVTSGQTILPQQHNPFITDAGQAITDSLSRDGRGGMRNNLSMSGFRVENMAAGVALTDAATVGQLQSTTGVLVGAIQMWPLPTAPAGYLVLMGQSLSRAQYPDLFAVLGTTFGAANGTSFSLPDMRGRVIVGLDASQDGAFADRVTLVNSRVIGTAGGAQSVTLTAGQMPKHDHDVTIANSGGHAHRARTGDGYDSRNNYLDEGGEGPGAWRDGFIEPNSGLHTHPVTEAERGNSEAHPNVQPCMIMNYIIKAF